MIKGKIEQSMRISNDRGWMERSMKILPERSFDACLERSIFSIENIFCGLPSTNGEDTCIQI
jgi:hypothetical protein